MGKEWATEASDCSRVSSLRNEDSEGDKREETAPGQKAADSKQVAAAGGTCGGAGRKWGWNRAHRKTVREALAGSKAAALPSRIGTAGIHGVSRREILPELTGATGNQLSFHFRRGLCIMPACLAIIGLC